MKTESYVITIIITTIIITTIVVVVVVVCLTADPQTLPRQVI
jgi:hypothetical protein